jgi:hypothetical protein
VKSNRHANAISVFDTADNLLKYWVVIKTSRPFGRHAAAMRGHKGWVKKEQFDPA